MTNTPTAVQQANMLFPHLEIELRDDRLDRIIRSRRIGAYSLTHFRAPATVVETVGRRSIAAGLGKYLKMVWQLGGRMRYEDANGAVDVCPGDMIVTSMSGDYWMEMNDEHEALIVAFDPNENQRWASLARRVLGTRVAARAAISAAASGIGDLLQRVRDDQTEELATRAMLDLALCSTETADLQEPPLLARAGLSIVRNIADVSYGPDRLARDLGMSRRSLYTHLTALGTTPAALIRRIRLDRARQDILRNDGRSLLDIALANGYPDGASLSHAFRNAYGQTPSSLRGMP